MSGRTYEGPPLDGTYQHFSERPYGDEDGETVDVVESDGDDPGEATVEGVPIPDDPTEERGDPGGADPIRPDVDGQSTWDDWRGSA